MKKLRGAGYFTRTRYQENAKWLKMEHLEGEGIQEMIINRFKRLMEWLKPNPDDSLLIQSLKMIYKALAVLVLIAFSPVILILLLFAFFAAI